MSQSSSVLVVGGYGVIGSAIGNLMAQRNPDVTVVVAGRNLEQAQRRAAQLPRARAARIDVTDLDPLASLDHLPDAIVVAVNDRDDRLLRSATERGIPLVDIARWGRRVEDVDELLEATDVQSPVVMASGWMASAASVVLAASRSGKARASQVDLDILFAAADIAGPDSVTGFLGLHEPFQISVHGSPRTVTGMTDPHRAIFSRGRTYRPRRVDSPEHVTHLKTGLTDGSAVRIAFDTKSVNALLTSLVRTGIWQRLSLQTRRGLLYNKKNTGTAPHEVLITVHDDSGIERISVIDPFGQSHFTAASAVSQAERLLGSHDRVRPQVGISYPEQATDVQRDVAALREMGVKVARDDPR